MFARKAIAAPATIEERLAASEAKKGAALSVFEVAAADLKEAAEEAREIQSIVTDEISRLLDVHDAAASHAADSDTKAANFLALIG